MPLCPFVGEKRDGKKTYFGGLQGKEMYGEKIHLHKISKQLLFI